MSQHKLELYNQKGKKIIIEIGNIINDCDCGEIPLVEINQKHNRLIFTITCPTHGQIGRSEIFDIR